MRKFYIRLVYHGITHGRVNLDMSQKSLNLLDRHSFVDGSGRQRPSELVRMDSRNFQFSSQIAQPHFYTGNLQTRMRLVQRYEQCLILGLSGGEILLQVQFPPGIEINDTLLVPFSEYDALPLGKIDVTPVQLHQFSDTHAS